MSKIRQFKYHVRSFFDSEFRTVRSIILNGRNCADATSSQIECNQVFLDRLKVHPKALTMSFWKNHFEWNDLLTYPEINGTVLDFGCGSGHSDIFLARNGRAVHGIDLSEIGIAIAEYLRERESPEIRANVTFQVADVLKDKPETLFDSAWASHVFEHIPDPAPVLAGLRGWLKPGARMLVSVPLGRAYDDPSHVHHFNCEEELRQLLERGVVVERIDCNQDHKVLRAICRF